MRTVRRDLCYLRHIRVKVRRRAVTISLRLALLLGMVVVSVPTTMQAATGAKTGPAPA